MDKIVAHRQQLLAKSRSGKHIAERADAGCQSLVHQIVGRADILFGRQLRIMPRDAFHHHQVISVTGLLVHVVRPLAVGQQTAIRVRIVAVPLRRIIDILHKCLVIPRRILLFAVFLQGLLRRRIFVLRIPALPHGISRRDRLDRIVPRRYHGHGLAVPALRGIVIPVVGDIAVIVHVLQNLVHGGHRVAGQVVVEERIDMIVMGRAHQDVHALDVQDIQGMPLPVLAAQDRLHAHVGRDDLLAGTGWIIHPLAEFSGQEIRLLFLRHIIIRGNAVGIDQLVLLPDVHHFGRGVIQLSSGGILDGVQLVLVKIQGVFQAGRPHGIVVRAPQAGHDLRGIPHERR